MIKKILIISTFIGVTMGAELKEIEVKGIKVPFIYEKNNFLPTVNLQIIFKDSGSIEDRELEGLSRLSARILNEGTKKLGSTSFAKKLESKAIDLRIGGGVETINIALSSIKSEFDIGVSLLKDLIKDPNITEEALKKIKIETEGILLSKQQDFDFIANVNLTKTIFKDTPIQNQQLGTKDSLKKINLKSIKSFLKEHLVLNNVIVLIGGDIQEEEAIKSISSILNLLDISNIKNNNQNFVASDKSEILEEVKDTKQAYIYFGAPFYLLANDTNQYKAKVMAFILGSSGFGSRIMEEIRVKRGLAYSAYTKINLNKTHSYFSGFLQTKLDKQKEALEVVKNVIEEFIKNGATEKELDGAKRFILGSEPLRNELLNQRLSAIFLDFYKGLPLDYRAEELKKIENLTLEELNLFIKEHSEILKMSFSIVKADNV